MGREWQAVGRQLAARRLPRLASEAPHGTPCLVACSLASFLALLASWPLGSSPVRSPRPFPPLHRLLAWPPLSATSRCRWVGRRVPWTAARAVAGRRWRRGASHGAPRGPHGRFTCSLVALLACGPLGSSPLSPLLPSRRPLCSPPPTRLLGVGCTHALLGLAGETGAAQRLRKRACRLPTANRPAANLIRPLPPAEILEALGITAAELLSKPDLLAAVRPGGGETRGWQQGQAGGERRAGGA